MFPSWIPAVQWAARHSPRVSGRVQTPELPNRWSGRGLPQEKTIDGYSSQKQVDNAGTCVEEEEEGRRRRKRGAAWSRASESEPDPGSCQCRRPGQSLEEHEEAGLVQAGPQEPNHASLLTAWNAGCCGRVWEAPGWDGAQRAGCASDLPLGVLGVLEELRCQRQPKPMFET